MIRPINSKVTVPKKRSRALDVLQSSSQLSKYGPYCCVYALITFILWLAFWTYLAPIPTESIDGNCVQHGWLITLLPASTQDSRLSGLSTCPPEAFRNINNNGSQSISHSDNIINIPTFDDTNFRLFSFVTAGMFASSFVSELLHLSDADIQNSVRAAPIYCTAIVNFISFLAHVSMALGHYPIILSPYGRVMHVVRWGEWVALVPLLMVMMHSVNLHSAADERRMWISTIMQQLSVLTGGVASFLQSWSLANVMMILSFATYFHIFYVLYYTSLALIEARQRIANDEKSAKQAAAKLPSLTGIDTTTSSSEGSGAKGARLFGGTSNPLANPPTSDELVVRVELLSYTMAANLALYCTISWSLIVLIYTLGMLHLIDFSTECILQSVMDVVAKMLYARVLCTSHGTVVSPEDCLTTMLLQEEQSNAAIRQFLFYIYHEVSSPMNAIVVGMNFLKDQSISDDGKITLSLAEEGCIKISETLKNLIQYQEVEDGSRMLEMKPFNIKSLIREIATSSTAIATDKSIMLLLAIDPRIPDIVLGERVRLKQAISILIHNGIDLTKHGRTCSIIVELKKQLIVESSTTHICFSVHDEGVGFSAAAKRSLMEPYHYTNSRNLLYSGFNIDLNVAKQVIQMHGGNLHLDTFAEKGSVFSFDIDFEVPAFSAENFNLLVSEVLTTSDPKISSARSVLFDSSSSIDFHQQQQQHQQLFRDKPQTPSTTSSLSSQSSIFGLDDRPMVSIISAPEKGAVLSAAIVDDTAVCRKILSKTLGNMGFNTTGFLDGGSLLDRVFPPGARSVQVTYDVIVIDNDIPIMSGIETVQVLRDEGYKGAIVGVISGLFEEEREEFLAAGCDLVYSKPLDIASFRAVLKPRETKKHMRLHPHREPRDNKYT